MKGGRLKQGINIPLLESLEIPLPPLAEQQAIAEVLRTVQRAKEATEKVIAATRQLKASLMKHLFTYGPVPLNQADQVPLKETETGAVPEHWRRSRVAELGRVVTGKTPSTGKPEYWNGDIPFITPADLPNGIIRGAERSISEQGLAVVKELPRGAVAVSCIGYIGKVGLIDCERSATNQQINAVVPTREHDPRFRGGAPGW